MGLLLLEIPLRHCLAGAKDARREPAVPDGAREGDAACAERDEGESAVLGVVHLSVEPALELIGQELELALEDTSDVGVLARDVLRTGAAVVLESATGRQDMASGALRFDEVSDLSRQREN